MGLIIAPNNDMSIGNKDYMAGVETIEELNEKWPSSYNFIDNLKQGNGVMK